MNKLNQNINWLVVLLALLILIQPVLAQGDINPLTALEEAQEGTGLTNKSPSEIVGGLIKAVLKLMSLILLVFFIIGGFMWMTSAGNEDKIKKAKGMIGAAVIGLVIVLLSYAATEFVIKQLMEVSTPPTS
ncbi:hypothetical protein ISS06_01235 [Patescibacteria group bacterium]|nr:hypothetical protein [Patescibacteria group bacterium]